MNTGRRTQKVRGSKRKEKIMNKAQSYLYVSSIIVCGGGWSKFVRMSFSIQCLEREVFLSLEALATQEQSWYTIFFFFLPKIATHIYHNLFVCRGHLLVSLLFYWQLSDPHRIQASHHHQTRNLLCLNQPSLGSQHGTGSKSL